MNCKLMKNALEVQWTPQTIALVVAVIVVLYIIVMIREHINTKKGETGEDLAKVRQVLKRLLPPEDYASYTTAYAFHKDSRYHGKSVTKTYYHYAVAFKPGALFVVPIQYSGGEVSYRSEGALLTKNSLGKVDVQKYETALFGLDGRELCRFYVSPSYTRQDKYEPFNIQQKEESKAFDDFIVGFAKEVNGQ